jgi:ribosome-binding ATPase
LSKLSGSQKLIPAAIEFVDIAGLVKGASKGEGLGNQFLSHIREVDAIVHVVRCFENSDIHHVDGSIDPIRDIEVINTELILADMEAIQRRKERGEKKAKQNDKEAKARSPCASVCSRTSMTARPAITLDLSDDERSHLKGFFLLSSKPCIYACNVSEDELAAATNAPDAHPLVSKVRATPPPPTAPPAVVISANIESELIDLDPTEASEYLKDLGVGQRRLPPDQERL